VCSVNVRWYSSIKDLKDQLHALTRHPPSSQHIFHVSNPTEFRNSSTLQELGIDQSGFTLLVIFDTRARSAFYLEALKPELLNDSCKKILEDVRLGLQRDKAPKVTDQLDGSGGVYFLRSNRGAYAAVFKPNDEEQGMPNNPKGYNGAGQIGLREHFRPGQGCLREVAAYIMDYDNFCGVPPTVLIHCQHSAFCYPGLTGNRKLFPKMGSLQQFVRASDSFEDLGSSQFSDFEVQKIALLDLRLLNCDRNAANMLVRLKNSDNGDARIADQSSFGADWTRSPSNSFSDDLYELVPIDHGYCMPSKLNITEYDLAWLYLPQVKHEVHPDIKDYCATLDFELMLHMLLQQIALPGNCIFLLALANLLVVQGIASGLTLFDIACIVVRMEDETQPSKLELAIEEAEENAFRAIEMRSSRVPSNTALKMQLVDHGGVGEISVSNSGSSDVSRNGVMSPSNSSTSYQSPFLSRPLSISVADCDGVAQKPSFSPGEAIIPTIEPSGVRRTAAGAVIGDSVTGTWDIQSIVSCANTSTPYGTGTPSSQFSPKVSVNSRWNFSPPKKMPSPGRYKADLGSDFLQDVLTAACCDGGETIAVIKPSPSPTSRRDEISSPKKSSLAPVASLTRPISIQLPSDFATVNALPTISEERRDRGGSTGSNCSEASSAEGAAQITESSSGLTTQDGATPDTVVVRTPQIGRDGRPTSGSSNECSPRGVPAYSCDGDVHIDEQLAFKSSSAYGVQRKDPISSADSDEVVYQSFSAVTPAYESTPPAARSYLTVNASPTLVSAISNRLDPRYYQQSPGGSLVSLTSDSANLATFPPFGTEITRLRSLGHGASHDTYSYSTAKFALPPSQFDKKPSAALNSASVFDVVGSISTADAGISARGDEVNKDRAGGDYDKPQHNMKEVESRPYHRVHDSVAHSIQSKAGRLENISPDSPSELPLILSPNGDIIVEDYNLGQISTDSGSFMSFSECADSNMDIKETTDGALNSYLSGSLSPLAKLTSNPSDPILASSLSVAHDPKFSSGHKIKEPKFRGAQNPHKESVLMSEKRQWTSPKKKSRLETETEVPAEGESRNAHFSASKAQHTIDDFDTSELSQAPSIVRVASFSGFQSAPIYDLVSEGRFGSLRQEKRRAIMKTPEFNKFRLQFAHEAVLSLIQRALKNKHKALSNVAK
jgi:hypothetical protein